MGKCAPANGIAIMKLKTIRIRCSERFIRYLLSLLFVIVFGLSSTSKLFNLQGFAEDVVNYRLLPFDWVPFVAVSMPWLELIVSIALLIKSLRLSAAFLIVGMMMTFTVAVGSAFVRGLDISCGCFGKTFEQYEGLIGSVLLRDLFLLTASMVLFFLILRKGKHDTILDAPFRIDFYRILLSPNGKHFLRYFFAVLIIVTVSTCLGMLFNQFRDQPLSLVYKSKAERLQGAVAKLADMELPKMVAMQGFPLQDITLDDFSAFVKEKRGLVLDARPEIFYRFGRVPGALSLPRDEFEKGYTKLKTQLEVDKGQPMIVYCSDGSCEDSELVSQALVRLGYTQTSVFRGGWDAWTKAGLPDEK